MEQDITPERIANAIMQDKDFNGFYLIVEGPKDFKLYNKFFDKSWRIKESFGCEKVKEVLEILNLRKFSKKIGIIDSDFNHILNTKTNIDGLFYTDYHDLEVMIIKTNALDTMINVFCKSERIEAFIKVKKESIREVIFELAMEIGYLKLTNKIFDLGLVFKPQNPEGNQIKYKEFISDRTLMFLGVNRLVQSLINYSTNRTDKKLDKELILKKYSEIRKNPYDINHLVNGHDLTNILYILIKKVLRSTTKMLNDFNCIEDSLILSYERSEFQKTSLYKELLDWSKGNSISIGEEGLFKVS